MSKTFKQKNLLTLLSFIIGFIYLFIIHIDIEKIDKSHFIINSKITQTKTLHIKRENNQSTIQCNENSIPLTEQKKKGYWYHGTESISIALGKSSVLPPIRVDAISVERSLLILAINTSCQPFIYLW